MDIKEAMVIYMANEIKKRTDRNYSEMSKEEKINYLNFIYNENKVDSYSNNQEILSYMAQKNNTKSSR